MTWGYVASSPPVFANHQICQAYSSSRGLIPAPLPMKMGCWVRRENDKQWNKHSGNSNAPLSYMTSFVSSDELRLEYRVNWECARPVNKTLTFLRRKVGTLPRPYLQALTTSVLSAGFIWVCPIIVCVRPDYSVSSFE